MKTKFILACIAVLMACNAMAEKWPTNITPGMLNAGKGNGDLPSELRVVGYSEDFEASYDADGRLIGITRNGKYGIIEEDGSITVDGYKCEPTFNAEGYISSLVLTKSATRYWEATFEYNSNNQLIKCQSTDNNDEDQTIFVYTLTYDSEGKILTLKKEKTEIDNGKTEVKPTYLYTFVHDYNVANPYGQYQDDLCDILFSEKYIEFFYALGLFGRASTVFIDDAIVTKDGEPVEDIKEWSTALNDYGLLTKKYVYDLVGTSGIDNVVYDGYKQDDIVTINSVNGQKQNELKRGINIVVDKQGNSRKVLVK